MKTIILNDINGSTESIIPYGLRLAKALESEVDILHAIDPRIHQGTYSSVSDSQSISPGDTRSHEEAIQHEKHRISMEMDKLLSGEASRLNYPLKINRVIVENSLEEELEARINNNPECLLVVNAKAEHEVQGTTSDIVRLIKKLAVPTMIIPPGKPFKTFVSTLMPLMPKKNKNSNLSNLKFLFDKFKVNIDAVGVALNGDYNTMELELIAWRDTVSNYYLPVANLKTNVLKGKDYTDTISNYFMRNPSDLLIIVNDKKKNKSAVSDTTELLKAIKSPVLVYFS